MDLYEPGEQSLAKVGGHVHPFETLKHPTLRAVPP